MWIMVTAIAAILILFCGSPSAALVTYDYTSEATLSLSRAWTNVASGVAPSQVLTGGTGTHSVSTMRTQSADLGALSYFQAVNVRGTAGDPTLTFSGTSMAENNLYTLFTIDFGNVPSDFTFTLTFTQITNSSRQIPGLYFPGEFGEFVGDGTGTQLLFDDFGGAFYDQRPITLHNLTGIHTMRLATFAEGRAIADYDSPVPEMSTVFLLAIGLSAVGVMARIRSLI